MFFFAIEPDIVLRMLEPRHANELAAVMQQNWEHLRDEMEWLTESFTTEDALVYIRAGLDRFAANNGFRAGIWWRGQLAGCVSLHSVDWGDRKASFGYWLGASFQGQGIVTRSCEVVIEHAFVELQLDRLEIQCAGDNVRSQQVAGRLGFRYEGNLRQSWRRRGERIDQYLYGLLRSEWSAAQAE